MEKARRHRLEYAFLIGFDRLINTLPYRMARGMGRFAAAVGHAICRKRIKEGRRRLGLVFGGRYSPRQERRIIRHAWRNMTLSMLDILRASRFSDEWFRKHTSILDVYDKTSILTDAGRGAVIACAHMGSWELAAAASQRFGIPIFAIAAPQKNPYFNRWMIELRARCGIETLLRGDPNLIRQVVKRLRGGQILAILPDVRFPGGGVETPFLGGTANIGPGMALFARMAGVPILPCLTYRDTQGNHRFEIQSQIEPDPALDRDADIRRMTLLVMQRIDTAIHEHPDQWFWFNKRWILDP